MLFLALLYLLAVWISYRIIKASYRVKNTDLLSDVVAFFLALVLGALLTLLFAIVIGLLFGS